jgi:cobalt-zinc-cadmium efflux system membrane fusion protein
MYVDITVPTAGGAQTVVVPRGAVQNVDDRQVVYVSDPRQPGRFIEREVRLGTASGEQVEVLSGVQPAEQVVSAGSFFVRAERERLGLRPARRSASPTSGPPPIGPRSE